MPERGVTTGFGSWLARQPEKTPQGKLAAVLRADLASGRAASWPRTEREVQEWAEKLRPQPTQLPFWPLVAVAEWQGWLDEITYGNAEHSLATSGGSTGHSTDNPFSRATAEDPK